MDATSTDSGLDPIEDIGLEFPEVEVIKPVDEKIDEKVDKIIIDIPLKKLDIEVPALVLPNKLVDVRKIDVELAFAPLEVEQEAYKLDNGKYKQRLREGDTEIHEYECPNGEVGYQVYLHKELDGKQMIKSFGRGQEKSARDFDWKEVINEE